MKNYWLIGLFILLVHLNAVGEEFDYYEKTIPGVTAFGRSIGGMYKKKHHKCSKPIPPLDLSKEKLTETGVARITLGSTIALVAFVISIAFANALTARLSNYGIIGGAVWAGDGFMKVFIAQYLIWFCWIAAIVALFGILWWAKDKSIIKLIKGKKNDKTLKKESESIVLC